MNKNIEKKRITAIILCILMAISILTGCTDTKDSNEDDSLAASSDAATYEQLLKINYLDVGQGDSTFIQLPNGQTVLIDGGEAEYADTIIDFLESEQCQTIDYLIATHPHSDHIGGLPKIIEHFSVKAVFLPDVQNNTQIFKKLLTAIKDKGLQIKTAEEGVNLLKESNLTADFIAPVGDSYADLNNYSAVLKLTYGNNSFLFMGDAENLSENEITAEVKADVLKAGHHGSNYSTSQQFIQRVQPKYAVISCGVDNQYGHPDPAAIDRLNAASVEIYRTDEMGTILFTSDGTNITVDKKASPKKENAPPSAPLPPSQSIASTAPTPTQNSPTSSQNSNAEGTQNQGIDAANGTQNNETTVYVTNTGSKYHLDGCQYLKQSKIPLPLSQARLSYEPCSKCNPPS